MRKVESAQCELGHQHITKETFNCDYCGGLIAEVHPRTINWFGRGVTSDVKEYRPFGGGERKPIVLIYQSMLQGMKAVEFYFCCASHALEFLRNPPEGVLPGDQFQLLFTTQAFSQAPLQARPAG